MKKKPDHLAQSTIQSLNRRMYKLVDCIDKVDRLLIINYKYLTKDQIQSQNKKRIKAQRIYFAIARYLSESTGMPFHFAREIKSEYNWLV